MNGERECERERDGEDRVGSKGEGERGREREERGKRAVDGEAGDRVGRTVKEWEKVKNIHHY